MQICHTGDEYSLVWLNNGGAPHYSGPFRLMQRPELRQLTKADGGGARAHRGIARRKMETRGQG